MKNTIINHKVKYKIKYKILSIILASIFFLQLFSDPKYVYADDSIEGIDIEQKLMVMKVGDKYKLEPSGYSTLNFDGVLVKGYEDVKGVKWKSSNVKIATIDSKGVITAKKSGRCIIKASYGKKTAQCKVRVYTKKELYQHVLDANTSLDCIFMSLTTNYYKGFDLIKASSEFMEGRFINIKAAKQAKKILDTVVTKDMNDYEKVMAIAKWLAENITVDDGYFCKPVDGYYSVDESEFPALLDGKSSRAGLGRVFALLLNCCGIRSEFIHNINLNTNTGEEETFYYKNVVELEGEFYYFDVIGLVESYAFYNSNEDQRKQTFYDLLVPGTSIFDDLFNITTTSGQDEGFDDEIFGHYYTVDLSLDFDHPSKYAQYYYDFYNDKVQFFTRKEIQKNENLCETPVFSTYPSGPDSSSKYKQIIKTETDLINKMVSMYNLLLDYKECDDEEYKSIMYDISGMDEQIASLIEEFDKTKDKIIDRNAVIYMKSKIEDIQKVYSEIQTTESTN